MFLFQNEIGARGSVVLFLLFCVSAGIELSYNCSIEVYWVVAYGDLLVLFIIDLSMSITKNMGEEYWGFGWRFGLCFSCLVVLFVVVCCGVLW